jgi:aromatic ring-opening dioxygenase LigB subunit
MPFQPGNNLGAKSKKFEQAIKRALADEDDRKLRGIADKVVALATDGERWAVEMLRDTLDGKPAQAMTIAGDEEAPPVQFKGFVELIHARGSTEKDSA